MIPINFDKVALYQLPMESRPVVSKQSAKMLDERHKRELLEKNPNIDITVIREKLNLIRKRSEQHAQQLQSDNGLELLKSVIASKSDWALAVALCESRMNQIRGIQLRDLQLVPIILFCERGDVKNIFLEVLSGEGKTMIIAIIAAVNVLLGRKVDIITTTDVLAAANNKEMKAFYESLGIISTTNLQSDEHTYENDIIYGTMFHFGKDFLKDSMKQIACGLCARAHQLCIIDEVDLLAIDNADHLVKVAKPFPGMEMLHKYYHLANSQSFDSEVQNLPKHLTEYCNFMKSTWGEIPILLTEEEFVIENKQIIPIDHQSGMNMRGAVFPNGAQQILEKGNNCPVTTEILNSITISNYTYIQMYNSLCGLTGTLGDEQEVELFSKVFNETNCYRIPSYVESQLRVLDHLTLNYNFMHLKNIDNCLSCEWLLKISPDVSLKFVSIPVQEMNETIENNVCVACVYSMNENTSKCFEINQKMKSIAYTYSNQEDYLRLLEEKINEEIAEYSYDNVHVIMINLKNEYLLVKFSNHERVKIVNDNESLDQYEDDIKLFIFDIEFNTQSALNNELLLYYGEAFQNLIDYFLKQGRSLRIIYNSQFTVNTTHSKISRESIKFIGVQEEGSLFIDKINPIGPGVIILTTLIGARGMDYQITEELRANGGLHVICTFVPENKRIEQQAFGRAARNGQPGSAQICLVREDITDDIETIIATRNEKYGSKLTEFYAENISRLIFNDSLYKQFRQFIQKLQNDINTLQLTSLMVEDLIEFWAFWLKYKKCDKNDFKNSKPEDMLQQFHSEAMHIINFTGYHNPVYAAQRANYYFSQGEHEKASELIKQTLDDTGFCKVLILEYVHFARYALLKRNACDLAKEVLTKVKYNEYEIHVDKYIIAIANQEEMLNDIKDEFKTRTFVKYEIKQSYKSASVLLLTGVLAFSRGSIINGCDLLTRSTCHLFNECQSKRVTGDLEYTGEALGRVCNDILNETGLLSTFFRAFDTILSRLITYDESSPMDYEHISNTELILKTSIDKVVTKHLCNEKFVITREEVYEILNTECPKLINFHENTNSIPKIVLKGIMKTLEVSFIKPLIACKYQNDVSELRENILALVEHLCLKIKERNNEITNEITQYTPTTPSIYDEIKLLFDYIPNTFVEMTVSQMQAQTTTQHQAEFVQG